ncbi:hypothetical protein J2X31_002523 [Flavobacterium arsenatis]|uniref:Peptidase C39 domain-containing protein n=1 Tax=Flavobacterium arsenatis TaxID=1484332 RepID=A0ABU1TRK3_9FLAO|nr:cysteine peptidase family C39 domain-containing protein [Flavobacterium arsenatis]MDR6968500.1 hypothetical protein [Flavobacterium arsenatis]
MVFFIELQQILFVLPFVFALFVWNADLSVPVDALGYYTGFIIGMLVDIIISIVFTGGAKTVGDVVKLLGKQFDELLKLGKIAVDKSKKVIKNLLDEIIAIFAKIRNGAKNIKPFLDEILEWLRKTLKEAGIKNVSKRAKRTARTAPIGDINKSFFENANIIFRNEEGLGLISGQTKGNTCVANSLRMVLDDLGIVKYEDTLEAVLKTDKNGANILDIPKALENAYIEGVQTIARGSKKDINVTFTTLENALKTGNKKAVVSVKTKDFGAHAIVVNKIENGRVFVRDPLPLNIGSSYSVSIDDFISVFNDKFVTLKL